MGGFGPVYVQASEFAKLMMVVVLAGYVAERSVGEHIIFLRAVDLLFLLALLIFL